MDKLPNELPFVSPTEYTQRKLWKSVGCMTMTDSTLISLFSQKNQHCHNFNIIIHTQNKSIMCYSHSISWHLIQAIINQRSGQTDCWPSSVPLTLPTLIDTGFLNDRWLVFSCTMTLSFCKHSPIHSAPCLWSASADISISCAGCGL